MTLKDYLKYYLLLAAEKLGAQVVSAPPAELLSAARREVEKAESLYQDQQDGEFKRHQVYAALLKKFPRELKREVGFAIEVALRK